MDNTIKRINEILTKNNQMMVSRPDGLFEIKNVKDKSEKKTFFQWFEKKFFGLLEECQNEYERFEKMKNLKYSYECPDCGKINRFESEVIIIRCDKCDHVFNIEIQRAIKESEKENPYLRMSAYLMEDFGYTNGSPRKGDEWEILDVNCLPEIIKEKCEVQINVNGWSESRSYTDGDFNLIIKYLSEGVEYRFRKIKTPTKKTHEELALEWIQENFSHSTVKGLLNHAYIAGRKSMESES